MSTQNNEYFEFCSNLLFKFDLNFFSQKSKSWNSLDPNNSHPNPVNQAANDQQTHSTIPNHPHSQQGFQSYSGLKPPTQSAIGNY